MIITDEFEWDHPTFEAHVEGMCSQVATHPSSLVTFHAPLTPLTILTLFATWKVGKTAFPLNPKNPLTPQPLFQPTWPTPCAPTPVQWNLSSIATHLYTSGSSGKPKIACHTLQNHLLSAQGSFTVVPLQEHHCWGLTLPLYHVGALGILFRCYLSKAHVLLSQNLSRATHLSFTPTHLYRALRDNLQFPHLQTLLLGGAPLPALQTPWNILPTYGMTEMSSQIVTNHTLHPHAEMTLAPDGEIWVRGGILFQGYLNATTTRLNPKGWFETGDLGRWHHNRFEVIGRKDNLFISGGENIQPEEIEAAIRDHCGIPEAIVIPIPDVEFGARPAVLLPNPSLLPFIQAKLQYFLPKFKLPIRAFPLPPVTELKLNRKQLIKEILLIDE